MTAGTTTEIEREDTTFDAAKDIITMDDVVRAATIEIQQKDQEFLVSDNFDVDSNKNSNKTHFAYFEDHNNDRIAESEKVALDRLVVDVDDDDESTANGGSIGIDDQQQHESSETVSWNRLKALLSRGIDNSSSSSSSLESSTCSYDDYAAARADKNELFNLYQQIESNGGYLVLELEDTETNIVRDMWSTMEQYFALPEDQKRVDLQTLEKKDGSHDPKAGYHFCQTYMNKDGVVLPETIPDALNKASEAYNGISGSYKLFAEVCKTVGTIAAAGALQKDLSLMHKVVTSLLDDKNGHPFVNAEHRLSQYIISPEDFVDVNVDVSDPTQTMQTQAQTTKKVAKAKESLISHTDWTFTTCIPLSAIPGLQLWKPHSQEWIVPEQLFSNDSNNDNTKRDRTNYVVVMTGKWIELLTQQKLSSCVHRVVTRPSSPDSKPRLSAPFFCRTRRYVFDAVHDEYHTRPYRSSTRRSTPASTTSTPLDLDVELVSVPVSQQQEAIDEMSQLFFGDLIRFTEGSRDSEIASNVVEMCMDHGDSMPDCYSVEDVLG